jgi:serine/threonine protein kinase
LGAEVYVVEDPDLNTDVVIKVFDFNAEENEIKFEKEIEVGLKVVKESEHFVHYLERFKWGKYWCIKMEYFNQGNVDDQIKNGRIFTEEVFVYFCLKLLFYI